ncbi:uncharacterized protein RCO7_03951 [Rhynchosporium graminicola]|uniref:Uncharacterized protein n=1 Tax=Rhynchosporium graminicola TaxID=2792576 RepID=A0A1E1L5H4_9HELO|nr:uncharacterized protein RCO7_03951 [Rhynchosporium commune]
MPSSRRILTPLAAIAVLIFLSVLAVVSLGEGFKKFGNDKDGVNLKKRDTITFSMPWNPAPNPAKAISPASADILNAVAKVAAALLGGGSDIAVLAQSAVDGLSSTILLGGTASGIQNANSAVDQATGVVAGIVSAATGIVGSLIAGTGSGAANITSAVGGSITSSVGGHMTASARGNLTSMASNMTSTRALNVSSSTSSMAMDITSAPVLNMTTSTSATICASSPTCTACPAAKTETCTVTETWHSTHYESTATLFSFIAAFTYTCTETISVCPKSSLYPLAPPSITSPSPTNPPLIACPDGVSAKRGEDCLPISPSKESSPSLYPDKGESAHPCPNAGYSCSECPNGVFCPPTPTSAQTCPCGWGWACGHCSQGWFCVPSPTSVSRSSLLSTAAAISGNGSASASQATALTSAPSTMPSFTANLPTLPFAASALTTSLGSVSGLVPASFPSTGPLNQATSIVGNLAGNIINNVNSALGNIDGLSGAILNSVIGQLSSVLGSNFPSVTGATGGLIPSVTSLAGGVISNGAAAVSNLPAGGLIPSVTSLAGGVISNGVVAVSNLPAGGLIPIVTGIAGNILSNVPGVVGNPATAGGILSGGASGLPAGIPIATPAVIFRPAITPPIVGGLLPILAKVVNAPITRSVIPQPLVNSDTQSSTTTEDEGPNVISHLTTTIQGTPTVLPVVITLLNGKPTVVPLVKMIVDGKEKDLPIVGMDLGKVKAAKDVLDGDGRGEGAEQIGSNEWGGDVVGKKRRGRAIP